MVFYEIYKIDIKFGDNTLPIQILIHVHRDGVAHVVINVGVALDHNDLMNQLDYGNDYDNNLMLNLV